MNNNLYEDIGMLLDENANMYYIEKEGLSFFFQPIGNNYTLTASLEKLGAYPEQNELKQLIKGYKNIRNVTVQGHRVIFGIKNALTPKKNKQILAEALEQLVTLLKDNGYRSCCEVCGRKDGLGLYSVGGIGRVLCDEHYRSSSESLVYQKQEYEEKKENIVGGIAGAFLGSLIGVAAIVLFGQLGFISFVAGVIMGACTIKGYEMLGGKLSKIGVVICAIIMLGMSVFANRLDWSVTIARELEWNIFDAFRECDYVIDYVELKADYYRDLAFVLVFTLLAAVPYAIGAFSEKKRALESHVIKAPVNNNEQDETL